jgi:Domain of unknown function (DUF4389)
MTETPEPPEFEPANSSPPPEQQAPDGESAAYWQPMPPASSAAPVLYSEPSPVLVSYPGPAAQRRWTIAIRGILAIPHLVVLYFLDIALGVVVLIGWFAALFLGRLPEWAHTFITGVLRWQTRVYAYLFLLTDVYPPFSLEDDAGYPVRLLTRPTRLSRLAVLFRFILVIPAALLAGIAYYGMVILAIIGWLIGLVAGKLPAPIHLAVAAVNRYSARYAGYMYLVTGEYPWGLFGDQAAPGPEAGTTAVAEPAFAPTGEAGVPAVGATAPGTQAWTVDPWRLTLSGAARGTLTACLVVGAGVWGAGITADALITKSAVSNTVSLVRIEQANSVLGRTLSSFPSAVAACNQQLTCVTQQDRSAGQALETFAASVSAAGVSGSAAADANTLANDSGTAGRDLLQLGSATSVAQYESIVANTNLQDELDLVSSDYLTLIRELGAK